MLRKSEKKAGQRFDQKIKFYRHILLATCQNAKRSETPFQNAETFVYFAPHGLPDCNVFFAWIFGISISREPCAAAAAVVQVWTVSLCIAPCVSVSPRKALRCSLAARRFYLADRYEIIFQQQS